MPVRIAPALNERAKLAAANAGQEVVMSALLFIPGGVCLFLGVVFLLLFRYGSTRAEASEHRMTAQGWAKLIDTGTRTEYNYENRARTVHFGVYEYDTTDGQHISSASSFGYGNPKDVPGTGGNMVKVCYNPNDPNEFALLEEQAVSKTIWPVFRKVGFILSVLGILLTAAAVAALLGLFDFLPEKLIDQAENGSISFSFGNH